MGRRIRFLPGVDRSEIDAKPVGLQRHGSHHFGRYLFVVYIFHGATGGLKAIAKIRALLTPADRTGPHDRIRSARVLPRLFLIGRNSAPLSSSPWPAVSR